MRLTEKQNVQRKIMAWLLTSYDTLIDYMKIDYKDLNSPYSEILKTMLSEKTADVTLLCSKNSNLNSSELRDICWDVVSLNADEFEAYVETLQDMINREKIVDVLNRSIINVKWYSSLEEIQLDIWLIFDRAYWKEQTTYMWDLNEILEEITGTKKVKIMKTWYRDLDNLIWWFEPWQIIVAWARPWVWKSMIAINLMMNNVLMWENVAMFSLEMPVKQITRRLISLMSWIWVRQLKSKLSEEELEKAKKWAEMLKGLKDRIFLIDDCWTIWEIEWRIRKLVHKNWVKIVYIDYLQLIRNPAVKNNPVESITEISQRLKQLALQLNITIIELSQLNRDADKTMVKRASQLRWSGSIEQDADMIRILDKEDETSNRIQLSVQKCRDWKIWDIELLQNSDVMQIANLPLHTNTPF